MAEWSCLDFCANWGSKVARRVASLPEAQTWRATSKTYQNRVPQLNYLVKKNLYECQSHNGESAVELDWSQ